MRRFGPLLAWSTTLAGVVAVMVLAGRGNLAAPPAAPARWEAWAAAIGPAPAAVAVIRLVVLALAAYLLLATLVTVAAELVRHALLVELSELLALPAIRRAVHTAVGASLVGATVAGGVASVSPARGPVVAGRPAEPVPVLQVVRSSSTTTSTTPSTTEPAPVADLVPVATTPPPDPSSPPSWTVAPGDHFWSIARRVLATGWHREPSETEVVPYWHALVEANRVRLRDPENADLVYPGDELLVPGLPSAPT